MCGESLDGEATDRSPNQFAVPEGSRQLVDHAGLAAGKDEPVDRGEFFGATHERYFGIQGTQYGDVLANVALQREDPDVWPDGAHQPRSARRCGAGRSATLIPTIASPRPRETSAMTLASS